MPEPVREAEAAPAAEPEPERRARRRARARRRRAGSRKPSPGEAGAGPLPSASRSRDSRPSRRPSPPLVLPTVIAIANQKGGVGKTTTAVNLGAALAELDYRVVVVDLDPQGNATTGLGVNPRDVAGSIYDVIMNDTPAMDAVEPTSLKNLFVVPATLDLAGAEIELVPAFSRELKLKRALDADPRRLRHHPHRLPAVAGPAHGERAGRRRRRDRPDPVRVLRARGARAAAAQRGQRAQRA